MAASVATKPPAIAEDFVGAIKSDGLRVASKSALLALKLYLRNREDDVDGADIMALIETGPVDLSGFPLSPEKMAPFRDF